MIGLQREKVIETEDNHNQEIEEIAETIDLVVEKEEVEKTTIQKLEIICSKIEEERTVHRRREVVFLVKEHMKEETIEEITMTIEEAEVEDMMTGETTEEITMTIEEAEVEDLKEGEAVE